MDPRHLSGLAAKSLLNRKSTAALTVVSIALSVALLVGVERIRHEARASFANTIAGTDLIVGARGGSVQLLLYSVFRIGDATNNISWQSYRDIATHRKVKWTVPISLGDSHRGYRVLGTNPEYFKHYRFGRGRGLELAAGEVFEDLYDAVLGAEVAEALGYRVGDELLIAHGAGQVSFAIHKDKPFTVAGILRRTGTPLDRTVHVSLQGIEAIHIDWQSGAPIPGVSVSAERARRMNLTPKAITAFLVGLESRVHAFSVQRFVNEYRNEPLQAILPGVALQQLWNLIGVAERALLVVSGFVVVVGLFGMLTSLLMSLNERRREMAVLRSVGARPAHVFALFMGEAAFLTLLGVVLGVGAIYGLTLAVQPLVESRLGLFIALSVPSVKEWALLGAVMGAGMLVGAIPSYRAYRYSLADGMTIRI